MALLSSGATLRVELESYSLLVMLEIFGVQGFIAHTFNPTTSNSISIFLREHVLVGSASASGTGTIEVRGRKVSR